MANGIHSTGEANAYWRKRLLIIREAERNKGVEFAYALDTQYQRAIRETEKDLGEFYARMAGNNEISISAARRYLDTAELDGFRMTLKEYQETAALLDLPDEYKKMLENASLRHRISRLEVAKMQMQHNATVLMKTEADAMDYFLQGTYARSFSRGAFEIFTGAGITFDSWGVDADRVMKIVHMPWAADGKNFSERIWGDHRPRLVSNLQQSLAASVARGEGPDRAIKAIASQFNVTRNAAVRLVQTESSFIAEQAKVDIFKELDVDEYEFASSLSERTCEVCGALDGKHWKMSEREIGVNFPPMHPNCTICTTIPYVDPKELEGNTRTAKDANGNTVYIPANMKYDEWKRTYLEGGKIGDTIPAPTNAGFDKSSKAFWKSVEQIGNKPLSLPAGGSSYSFTPAKTMDEAKAWTLKNRAESVDFGNLSLDQVNAMNEEMGSIAHDVPIMRGKYKTIDQRCSRKAYMCANGSRLGINVKLINLGERTAVIDRKWLETQRDEYIKDGLTRTSYFKRIQKSLKYERWAAYNDFTGDEKIKSLVAHESGHSILFRKIEDQVTKNNSIGHISENQTDAFRAVNNAFYKARKTGDIYKISEYGNKNYHEFFAETFAMYRRRKSELPKYIIEMIEGVIK